MIRIWLHVTPHLNNYTNIFFEIDMYLYLTQYTPSYDKKCEKNLKKIEYAKSNLQIGGIGQMTTFDHEGGREVKISENLTTWYMNDPYA